MPDWGRRDLKIGMMLARSVILFLLAVGLTLTWLACQPEPQPPAPATVPPPATATPLSTFTPTPAPAATLVPTPTPAQTPTRTPASTPPPPQTATPIPTPTPNPSPLAGLSNGLTLEESDPAAADTIKGLAWVTDGLTSPEMEHVELLIDFALAHSDLFSVLVGKPWVDDGIHYPDSDAISTLADIAILSPTGAVAVMRSGLLDHENTSRINNLRNLRAIAQADVEQFDSIMEIPWLQDGVQNRDLRIISELSVTASGQPASLASIINLPLVTAGGSETVRIISALRRLAANDGELFSRVMQNDTFRSALSLNAVAVADNINAIATFADAQRETFEHVWNLPWVADGLEPDELSFLFRRMTLAELVPGRAAEIARMFNMDAPDADDMALATALERAAQADPALVDTVLARRWTADGIEPDELSVLTELVSFAELAPDFGAKVASLPFLDTVEPDDVSYLAELEQMARTNSAEFRTQMNDPEVERTTERDVAKIEERLRWLRHDQQRGRSSTTPEQIQDLAFRETDDAVDVRAIAAMRRLARGGELAAILEREVLQDGITDAEAKILTTLACVSKYNPELIDTLLDPEQVLVEDRLISTPLSGAILLTIIRTSPGLEETMDLLEHAVRTVEDFMGIPLPTNYVAYLFEEATGGTRGRHCGGTSIISRPYVDKPGHHRSAQHIAHEVAHYYWIQGDDWIDEGGADFMAILSENIRVGSSIEPNRDSCEEFANIQELVRYEEREQPEDTHTCNYRLGQRFFLDMYDTLGEDAFWHGVRNWYQGEVEGINGIRAAFQKNATISVAKEVDTVIDRWYYSSAAAP